MGFKIVRSKILFDPFPPELLEAYTQTFHQRTVQMSCGSETIKLSLSMIKRVTEALKYLGNEW